MGMAAWLMLLAGVSAAGTWLALAYARRRNLLDHPGERRSHAVPTPRGGGIGIAVALLVASLLAAWTGMAPAASSLGFAAGLVLVAGIGWMDDHRPLSPWLRLGVQCVAGLVLAWGLYGVDGQWSRAAMTLLLVPVLVNVWNFMDGIDGLAATQAILAAIGMAVIAPYLTIGALAFAAAVAGFLPFNFPRARIFLGDAGSGTLGYVLAALTAWAVGTLASPYAPVLLLPLSVFMIDAALTLGARMLSGERWWQPHTSHLYQRWVKAGRSHVFVTSVYAVFSLAAIILAGFLKGAEPWLAWGGVAIWLAFALLGWVQIRRLVLPGKGK